MKSKDIDYTRVQHLFLRSTFNRSAIAIKCIRHMFHFCTTIRVLPACKRRTAGTHTHTNARARPAIVDAAGALDRADLARLDRRDTRCNNIIFFFYMFDFCFGFVCFGDMFRSGRAAHMHAFSVHKHPVRWPMPKHTQRDRWYFFDPRSPASAPIPATECVRLCVLFSPSPMQQALQARGREQRARKQQKMEIKIKKKKTEK